MRNSIDFNKQNLKNYKALHNKDGDADDGGKKQ